MPVIPWEVNHNFVDDGEGTCRQKAEGSICGMSDEHKCHWWPLDPIEVPPDNVASDTPGRTILLEALLGKLWVLTNSPEHAVPLTKEEKKLWESLGQRS